MKKYNISFQLEIEEGHPNKWVPEALKQNLEGAESAHDFKFELLVPDVRGDDAVNEQSDIDEPQGEADRPLPEMEDVPAEMNEQDAPVNDDEAMQEAMRRRMAKIEDGLKKRLEAIEIEAKNMHTANESWEFPLYEDYSQEQINTWFDKAWELNNFDASGRDEDYHYIYDHLHEREYHMGRASELARWYKEEILINLDGYRIEGEEEVAGLNKHIADLEAIGANVVSDVWTDENGKMEWWLEPKSQCIEFLPDEVLMAKAEEGLMSGFENDTPEIDERHEALLDYVRKYYSEDFLDHLVANNLLDELSDEETIDDYYMDVYSGNSVTDDNYDEVHENSDATNEAIKQLLKQSGMNDVEIEAWLQENDPEYGKHVGVEPTMEAAPVLFPAEWVGSLYYSIYEGDDEVFESDTGASEEELLNKLKAVCADIGEFEIREEDRSEDHVSYEVLFKESETMYISMRKLPELLDDNVGQNEIPEYYKGGDYHVHDEPAEAVTEAYHWVDPGTLNVYTGYNPNTDTLLVIQDGHDDYYSIYKHEDNDWGLAVFAEDRTDSGWSSRGSVEDIVSEIFELGRTDGLEPEAIEKLVDFMRENDYAVEIPEYNYETGFLIDDERNAEFAPKLLTNKTKNDEEILLKHSVEFDGEVYTVIMTLTGWTFAIMDKNDADNLDFSSSIYGSAENIINEVRAVIEFGLPSKLANELINFVKEVTEKGTI
jgi:hypothetical protein